jgi:hypothetical protein
MFLIIGWNLAQSIPVKGLTTRNDKSLSTDYSGIFCPEGA